MASSQHQKDSNKRNDSCKSKVKQFTSSWTVVVVIATFVGFALEACSIYTVNIFYVEFLDEFKESRSYTSWIGSLHGAMFQIAGPLSSWIIRNYGCRPAVLLGGGGAAIGYAISSLANSIGFLIFSLGLLSGTALNFAYSGLTVALGLYCHSYYKLATSLAFSGIGFGIFIFSYVVQFAVDCYGWRGAMLICAGINLNLCVCGCLLFPSEVMPHSSSVTLVPTENKKEHSNLKSKILKLLCCKTKDSQKHNSSFSHSNAVCDLKFICLNISCSLWVMASITLFVIYKDIVVLKGWGDRFYILLLCSGIADIVGRISVGIIVTTEKCSVITYFIICLFIAVLSFVLQIMAVTFEVFLTAGFLFSLTYSKQSVLMILTPSVLYGRKRLASSLGIMLFWSGWASLIGPPIGGFIIDSTGDSSSALLFSSFIELLAAIFMIAVRLQIYKEEQLKTKSYFLQHIACQEDICDSSIL